MSVSLPRARPGTASFRFSDRNNLPLTLENLLWHCTATGGFIVRVSPRRWLLLTLFAVLALFAVIFVAAPVQVPIAAYKLALALVAGIAGHLLDCAVFPYAMPSSYLCADWRADPDADHEGDADFPVASGCEALFVAAMLRKAAIVAVFVLGVCLGL